MLSSFRAFAKSPLAGILIAILVISFGLFGVRDVFKGHSTSEVVVAGTRTISPQDFKSPKGSGATIWPARYNGNDGRKPL